MKTMISTLLAIGSACAMSSSYAVDKLDLPENNFVALTFHDVRDDVKPSGDRDLYAISTKNLSAFFEWINKAGWHPITLQQLEDAKKSGKKLPDNAIILCFDDGALSSYTHVLPLLKLYNIPAVFAIPTSWINGNTKDGYEAYGQGNLMTWNQMREMQNTGLVEFASHSDDLHKGILANPQANKKPAAIYRMYLEQQQRYETDQEFTTRIYNDLKQSKQILDQELGIKTNAIIWPYGAVNKEVADIATKAGLPWTFSLGKSVANGLDTTLYQRLLIIDNPTPEDIHSQVLNVFRGIDDPLTQSLRVISLPLSEIYDDNSAEKTATPYQHSDERLGLLLNQIDALKSNTLLLDVVADQNQDGVIDQAFFSTSHIAQSYDVLSRVDWQARTRVNQYVMASLPMHGYSKPNLSIELAKDIIKMNASLNAINLDIRQDLSCMWHTQTFQTPSCQQAWQEMINTQAAIQTAVAPYINISGNYFSALRTKLESQDSNHIQKVLTLLAPHTDLITVEVDSLNQAAYFKAFLQALASLDSAIKSKLQVSMLLASDLKPQVSQQLQQQFIQLQQQGIQKLGITGYQLKQGKEVHAQLYPALSLNQSSVTYQKSN